MVLIDEPRAWKVRSQVGSAPAMAAADLHLAECRENREGPSDPSLHFALTDGSGS